MRAPDPAATADLELLTDAALAAGQIAMGFWQKDPEVWSKGDDSPVTEADLAVNDMLAARLREARPGYGWLSEETPDDRARLQADTVFIVDPIDGTRAFVGGERTWAHAIAVATGGQVTAAIVYLPARDKLYAATLGGGARLNGTPLTASPRTALGGATLLANKYSLAPKHWPRGVPPVTRQYRPSLAYRLALVGEGRFDAMVTFRDTWEWDIAAGALIATEAGAVVTDRHGHANAFNRESARAPGVLTAAPGLHPALLAGIA